MENINFEQLRKDLMDFFGTAAAFNPAVMMYVTDAQRASNEELLNMANNYGFDLENYKFGKTK